MARSREAKPEQHPEPEPLSLFHPAVRGWFEAVFDRATTPQRLGWPAIAAGNSSLILAPTGTGKTLAAFLWCLNRIMFSPTPDEAERCRILYISPIKALAVDVERNLRAPLVGIAQEARRINAEFHEPSVAIRTGDTPSAERARFARHPSDILITTPESLYLLLTSNARAKLASIETVILDEIHALVPTKRGAHLALSLERLERLTNRPLQRIGLSATQRPLEEVAHFLGGANTERPSLVPVSDETEALAEFEQPEFTPEYRPVVIVDASERKKLELKIEVPVEDMARLDEFDPLPSGPAAQGPVRPSIWSAIHPKLLELVRSHQSTLIFVNSRRLAERISGAINELAGETIVRAHHGSVAVAQRKEIEDRLKLGTLRGLVATSSLELGIDMGAVDLVVQVEAPPSVSSGMQRIGRASHRVGAVSKGTVYPKYRADLLACAAAARAMYEGRVESIRYPRNPLDVLAQQLVAMVAMDEWNADALFDTVRRAAPFGGLTRPVFDGVLDMLSGRYPSDEFAELRPRITWDRVSGTLTPREGSRSIAVVNGGTIPDRGLFGVFLAGTTHASRVGELDEEMVFESRTGDTIILGATTWRIEEITHDRVLVSPAPGEPGKMPFWHGDTAGRPAEFGAEIGRLTRELQQMPRAAAFSKLVEDHSLDTNAAENLMRFIEEQAAATQRIPSDIDVIVERVQDELGDWRVCVLTPFGSRVHAPWCMAVTGKIRSEMGLEVESMWSDDGFVLRLPEGTNITEPGLLTPTAAEVKDQVLRQLGNTSLFAAKFRESSSRALLLPRRRPGMRTALWQQRKRSADLLSVAARYSTFPMLLETYRECMRDVFDMPALTSILRGIHGGQIRVTHVESQKPSPFASSLLFSYIANYIYEGDAPLAERRAQALSIDQSQLQELLGDTDFRELLDPAALDEVESQLQFLDPDYKARHADALHDMLLRLGDLNAEEIHARSVSEEADSWLEQLQNSRRVVRVRIGGTARYVAVEDAARYRDALGTPLPPGLPEVLLSQSPQPLLEIVRRYARTHGPFTTSEVSARYGISAAQLDPPLRELHSSGKLLEGEFRPLGSHREWCDSEVLRLVRRKTLARLRREVEPVEQQVFVRFLTRWQGVVTPRRGMDALLDVIENLQGATLIASELEREILPTRIAEYKPADLDMLIAAGEVIWVGVERVGERDGRISLYLADSFPLLYPPIDVAARLANVSDRARAIYDLLKREGALFSAAIHANSGGGFPGDTTDALWELAWAGLITNDTYHSVRGFLGRNDAKRPRVDGDGKPGSPEFLRRFRSRAKAGGSSQGRWSLIESRLSSQLPSTTEWSANLAQQLLVRYGIVARETAAAETFPGGYSTVYPAFKVMEESGWVRRGMFVTGLGASQFAMASAVDLLRSLRVSGETPDAIHLSASDPANPYGAILPWAKADGNERHGMSRSAGASVCIVNGLLAAFLRRRNPSIQVLLPEDEPDRSTVARALAKLLASVAIRRQTARTGLFISEINATPAREHYMARFLTDAGFVETAFGFQMRRVAPPTSTAEPEPDSDEDEHEETA